MARLVGSEARRTIALTAPGVIFLAIVFVAPLLGILMRSFAGDDGFTTEHYRYLLENELYRQVLVNTMKVAAYVTIACLGLGYAMAYAIANYWSRWASLLLVLIIIAFWSSMLARTYAWMVILGREGMIATALGALGITDPPQMIHNEFGAVTALVNVMLPYMVLPLYGTMRGVDAFLPKAASTLGAPPRRVFRRVYLPLTMPGIAAGSLLVFMMTLGFYITPALVGGPQSLMISELIAEFVQTLLNWELAAALSVILMGTTLLTLVLYMRFVGFDNLVRSYGSRRS